MKSVYDEACLECSKTITTTYSTSFSSGIRFLDKEIRCSVYAIYGFVRLADEIVDTFLDYDQKSLFENFEKEYRDSLKNKISINPVLEAFQKIVHKYELYELVDAFLNSMKLDLYKKNYRTNEEYKEYIYGSADVVGLMCLKVFTKNDQARFDSLKGPAMKLGSAFQKVNFLRDLRYDFETLGRKYFPNLQNSTINEEEKMKIVQEVRQDFKDAYQGIVKLPKEARFGVYLAYKYYSVLLQKIEYTEACKIAKSRIRVSDPAKFLILVKSLIRYKLNIM